MEKPDNTPGSDSVNCQPYSDASAMDAALC